MGIGSEDEGSQDYRSIGRLIVNDPEGPNDTIEEFIKQLLSRYQLAEFYQF